MIGSIEIDRLEIREILADHPGHVRGEVMHGESLARVVGIRVSSMLIASIPKVRTPRR
jgi:hypothetical protein